MVTVERLDEMSATIVGRRIRWYKEDKNTCPNCYNNSTPLTLFKTRCHNCTLSVWNDEDRIGCMGNGKGCIDVIK